MGSKRTDFEVTLVPQRHPSYLDWVSAWAGLAAAGGWT